MKASSFRCIAFGLLAGVCTAAAGAEMILGTPAPRDPRKPGALVLHNGRTITWHDMAPGDTVQLRRAVPGAPVLLREETVLAP